MIIQLVIGSTVITATIIIQISMFTLALRLLDRTQNWDRSNGARWRARLVLCAILICLLGALTIAVWIWAFVFLLLDLFATVEEALYFSLISFTTLGFGDIILPIPWRLLSGMTATNGLLLFGMATAFLVEAIRRHRLLAELWKLPKQ